MIQFWSKFHIQVIWCSFNRDNRFILTFSHSLPGKQENPFSIISRHINNSLSVYLFLYSKLNNEGMIVHVKRVFKSYFLSRKQTGSAWNFLLPPAQLCRVANQRPHFLMLHLFRIISQPSGQNQQSGKQTHSRLPL